MARSTKVVSFFALVCIVYTSIVSETRAGTMPSGAHGQEPLEDGTMPRSHFDDFVRALTASQGNADLILLPSDEEMPNDVFPLDTDEHTKEVDQHKNAMTSFQKRGGSRYCGSILADVLEMVCGKSFLSLFGNKKRSLPADKAVREYKNSAESWPFVNGNKALQVLSNQHSFHRYTRGVHDECCLKACTFDELTGYCANPKPKHLNRFF